MQKSPLRLQMAFIFNLLFAIIELVGGLWINSLAIVSNALHDFVDAFTIGLSWKLESVAKKSKDNAYSYGYKRFSSLAAIINTVSLTLVTIYIVFEAVDRWYHPQPVDPRGIIVFALIGVVVNVASVLALRKGTSMNEKMMSLELSGDAISWVVVLITSIINLFYKIESLDSVLSVLIAMYILYGILKNLRSLGHIFLQGTPNKGSIDQIRQKILEIPLVDELHDVHLWSLDGEYTVFSAHVILDKNTSLTKSKPIKDQIRKILKRHQVNHSTLEVEFGEETAPQI